MFFEIQRAFRSANLRVANAKSGDVPTITRNQSRLRTRHVTRETRQLPSNTAHLRSKRARGTRRRSIGGHDQRARGTRDQRSLSSARFDATVNAALAFYRENTSLATRGDSSTRRGRAKEARSPYLRPTETSTLATSREIESRHARSRTIFCSPLDNRSSFGLSS